MAWSESYPAQLHIFGFDIFCYLLICTSLQRGDKLQKVINLIFIIYTGFFIIEYIIKNIAETPSNAPNNA